METIVRIGLDTSKSVFQLHGVDGMEQPVLRRKLRRGQVLAFFGRLPPALVAMRACGASHYWARELRSLGHEGGALTTTAEAAEAEQQRRRRRRPGRDTG